MASARIDYWKWGKAHPVRATICGILAFLVTWIVVAMLVAALSTEDERHGVRDGVHLKSSEPSVRQLDSADGLP